MHSRGQDREGAQPNQEIKRQTSAATLSTWDLARTRRKQPDTDRGFLVTLRAHQSLIESYEKERGVPEADRSIFLVKENATSSFLLIHGVSTGPGDLQGLASTLFDAGHNVYVLRLPDYGTPGHTISEVSWESALQQATQCYKLLTRGGGKTHIIGLGFGATLALLVAAAESVSSLVLIAPSLIPRESFFQHMLVRLKLHRLRFLRSWMGWSAGLVEGMDKARGTVSKIKVPMYAVQCEDDISASPDSLRFLQRKARNNASRFLILPEGGHDILKVHGEKTLYKEIHKFCADR